MGHIRRQISDVPVPFQNRSAARAGASKACPRKRCDDGGCVLSKSQDYEDALDWAKDRDWYKEMCRCGGDMPGLCFGPQNCPMCRDVDDGDDEWEEQKDDNV